MDHEINKMAFSTMNFLERHFPLPGWILKGIRARALTPHILAARSEIRAAKENARSVDYPAIDPESIPESAFLQIRLFREQDVRFKVVEADLDSIELAENEVLFVPQSFIVNKYILFYNSVYLPTDLGSFLDPNGTLNSRFFKTIPAWGVCVAHRSNHPEIEEGSTYHGFFPLGPYSVRSVGEVDRSHGTALQSAPGFKGPLEWLRLVRTDGHPDFVADLFEYFKIGITYARALRDLEAYGADQLVFSAASSTSAQIIAMCVKETLPDLTIVGLTSPRNFEMVKELAYFDEVHTYDDLASSDGARPSLYFDALGNESVSVACLEHLALKRWWIYAQGGQEFFPKLLKLNRRGSEYSNGIESLLYANRHGISDTDILVQAEAINQKHDLERRWGKDYRIISSPRELHELYDAFLHDTLPPGQRVRYVSPLLRPA
jgi:hypothetical protein